MQEKNIKCIKMWLLKLKLRYLQYVGDGIKLDSLLYPNTT